MNMALISKVESLIRMIDAFKTARYDQHVGHEARYPWKDDHITWLHNVYDLVTSAAVKSQKRYTKLLMDTLSMLFGICGMEEQSLRLAASETLNKIVKATYLTHITRIQMTAFNEMKKKLLKSLGRVFYDEYSEKLRQLKFCEESAF